MCTIDDESTAIDEYIDMIDGLISSGGPIINYNSIDDIETLKDSEDVS